jgi:hypothetical protein
MVALPVLSVGAILIAISTNDGKVGGDDGSESKIGVSSDGWKIGEQMNVISTGVEICSEDIVELDEAGEAVVSKRQRRFLQFVRFAIVGSLQA